MAIKTSTLVILGAAAIAGYVLIKHKKNKTISNNDQDAYYQQYQQAYNSRAPLIKFLTQSDNKISATTDSFQEGGFIYNLDQLMNGTILN